jgi:Protein of unknown function (DUF3141)
MRSVEPRLPATASPTCMPNRVKNGFRPSVSNCELSFSPAALRESAAPIVVFCSKGGNITPPRQALGWILDLYDNVDDIRAHGQTIVYTIHEHVGHLGIFVSGAVARKEHGKFANKASSTVGILQIPMLYVVFQTLRERTGRRRKPKPAHVATAAE